MAGLFNWFKRDEESTDQGSALQQPSTASEELGGTQPAAASAHEQASATEEQPPTQHDHVTEQQQPPAPEPVALAGSFEEIPNTVREPVTIAATNPRPRDRSREVARHVGETFVDELPIGESGRRPELRVPDGHRISSEESEPSSADIAFAAAFDDLTEFEDSVTPSSASGHPDAESPSTEAIDGAGATKEGISPMAQLDQTINELLTIDGASGAAIVDIDSGMALAFGGAPGFDLSVAAAGNSNVVRAKMNTMRDIGLTGQIEDIMITLNSQYHLINILASEGTAGLFIYLVLDRSKANLALARHKLKQVAKQVSV